jgi:hypothetical protein
MVVGACLCKHHTLSGQGGVTAGARGPGRIAAQACETHLDFTRTIKGSHRPNHVEELIFFGTFGAAVVCALLFGAAWARARRRLSRLEDRLLDGSARAPDDLEERVNELALRVAQLARGQEFLQQLFSGQRRLPQSGGPVKRS